MSGNSPCSHPLYSRHGLWAVALLLGCLLGVAVQAAEKVRLTIEFEGVSDEFVESILAQLTLEGEREHPLLDEYRIQRLHRQAPEEIRNALQPFGFYAPQITPSLTQTGEGAWTARYVIETGEPVIVTEVQALVTGEGANEPYFVAWRQNFPLRHGDTLLHESYEDAKRDLLRIARDKGYLTAQLLRHEIRVDVARRSATIELHLETGPRYRYGEVRTSETLLEESFVQGYITIRRGEYYDADRLLEMQRNLANSDYFQRADVIPLMDEVRDNTVPIDIKLAMRKRTRYSIGAGYATDTGPRGTLGVERRYVTDNGHRFSADLTGSEVRTTLIARYRIPLDKPATDSFNITSGWEEETLDTSYRETVTAGVGQTRQLSYWQQTLGLSYERERFEIADTEGLTTLLIPNVRWQRLLADNRIFPSKGWRVALGIKGASDRAVSDMSFLQGDVRGKFIFPLGKGRLITRAELAGSIVPDFQELPVSQRFFAGGDFSVRGYSYNSLGPTNASGEVVGGRHLIVGSAEYDHYFGKRFGLAAFIDSGNAFDVSEFHLFKGAGAGVRWRFPFGLLRIDGAQAIDDPDHRWRLHISLGPDL